MKEERSLRVLDSNILYVIGAFLFATIGGYVQNKDLITGILITEYVLILLPPFIYLLVTKINIKKTMRLNRLSIKHGLLIVAITLLMYPVAVFTNAFGMFLLSLFGNLNVPEMPVANSSSEYILLMFVVSMAPGICEEVFFRGFIMRGYEALGKKKAIILSAILFGIFHFNLYNLFGPIVLGLVFGYLVVVTDSLYAGFLGHIANNGFAVTLGFAVQYLTKMMEDLQELGMDGGAAEVPEVSTTVALLISMALFGAIALITGFIAYKLLKIIKKDMDKLNKSKINTHEGENNIDALQLQPKTKKYEYLPLLLVVPIIIFVIYVQLGEIMSLG
ncbi:CPBP family intramembrane metalloprotease [Alkaliphilus pronyensis]|uniref:CPBP family intramembrane metalloprotease n=1 Tax=Alkaliphilus pronyensis TaxID=1482732 RepID=A0A6I0F9E1_9FIRM|nr:type II CAAX endopeptidase family protein [Alkaliphilus pronyensis]KAB3535404.1 CPBP family intramembrane metalloprotease [Alkaliphilus pronyensis]